MKDYKKLKVQKKKTKIESNISAGYIDRITQSNEKKCT